jgi:hypothetical protein
MRRKKGVVIIGFQKMHPEEFVILAEILGNLSSLDLPYNLQNTIGNWLQLLGQVMITFNGQQQYFEQGPGRVFNTKNFNIDNESCPQNQSVSQSDFTSLSQQMEALQTGIDELKKRLDALEKKQSPGL